MQDLTIIRTAVRALREGYGALRRAVRVARQIWRSAMVGFKPTDVTLPSGNHYLSQQEFDYCCALIDYYISEQQQIIPYSKAHNRDHALFDRGNVWRDGVVDHTTAMLLSKKYNNVNRLRLIAHHFSNYRVFDLSKAEEFPATTKWFDNFYNKGMAELPDDLDSIITSHINPTWRIDEVTPYLDPIIDRIDPKYLHEQPLRFGEIAGNYRGFMVNGDSQRYWAVSAVLARSGIFEVLEHQIAQKGVCRVMEIGAGYGGLGYQLKKSFGDKLQFIAVDLVESLLFSSCYLATLLKDKALYYKAEKTVPAEYGLVFVPTFRSPEFFEAVSDVDLCINTISMNEMTADQVDYYGRMISKTLSAQGIFFECNWTSSISANRINNKLFLAPHFRQRLSLQKTEVSNDGDLDLWANLIPPSVYEACKIEYPPPNWFEIVWSQMKAYCRRY